MYLALSPMARGEPLLADVQSACWARRAAVQDLRVLVVGIPRAHRGVWHGSSFLLGRLTALEIGCAPRELSVGREGALTLPVASHSVLPALRKRLKPQLPLTAGAYGCLPRFSWKPRQIREVMAQGKLPVISPTCSRRVRILGGHFRLAEQKSEHC